MSLWSILWPHSIAALFLEPRDTPGQAYRYRSLGLASGASRGVGPPDEGDIRLLEVFPHPTGAGRIRCQLHHHLMLFPVQQRDYQALSYEWGTGQRDSLIIIDGKGYLVTEHLQTAIWRLRRSDRSIFLWIDAICIYQEMLVEKQMQISMMHDIYGIADEVAIYLSEEADNSDLVASFAQLLVAQLLLLEDSQARVQIQEKDLATYGLPPATDRRWKALRDLFNRSWFSRKWIIQECVLAKALTVRCGGWTFDFDLLRSCHELCLQHGLDGISAPGSHERLVINQEHPFHTYLTIRDCVRHNLDVDDNGPGVTLPWLLVNTHYAEVTEAHDAIYSLLGIYQLFGTLLGLPYPLVNYGRPVADVFTEYTSSLDWASDSVSLLEVAGLPKKIRGLPSWVPDWSYRSLRQPLATEYRPGHYSASKTADRAEFVFDSRRKILNVRGALFDVITETTTAIWDHDESISEIPSIMLRLFGQLNGPRYQLRDYPTHENMSSVLRMTMIGGAEYDQVGAVTNYARLFRAYKAHLDADNGSVDTPSEFWTFVATARNVCRTRKFCLTEKGFIGQVPSEARPGDSVCITLGERVPFILRSTETSWELIGDAYIHGIMRGEGLDSLDKEIREIVLV